MGKGNPKLVPKVKRKSSDRDDHGFNGRKSKKAKNSDELSARRRLAMEDADVNKDLSKDKTGKMIKSKPQDEDINNNATIFASQTVNAVKTRSKTAKVKGADLDLIEPHSSQRSSGATQSKQMACDNNPDTNIAHTSSAEPINFSKEHDGIDVGVNTSDDEFQVSEAESEEEDGAVTSSESSSSGDNSSSEEEEEDPEEQFIKLSKHPRVQKILSDLVDQKVEQKVAETVGAARKHKDKKKKGKKDKHNKGKSNEQLNKSPSDTTLYRPALRKGVEQDDIVNRISNFVDSLRGASSSGSVDRTPTVRAADKEDGEQSHHKAIGPERELAQKIIVEAEKFKADVAPPPKGMFDDTSFDLKRLLQSLDSDDDFFHITCHVDSNLKEKIEKGEFVELEKLLPKDKFSSSYGFNDGNTDGGLIKVMQKGGQTYITPQTKEYGKINGIRKWEQAFRVYAAIYCQAHQE